MPENKGKPWYTPEQNARYCPSKADEKRARQFMPFASLRGYYTLVAKQERMVAPRRELQEEDYQIINECLQRIQKGSIVQIRYYDSDAYVTVQGAVSSINPLEQKLTVIKTSIYFSDIENIQILSE